MKKSIIVALLTLIMIATLVISTSAAGTTATTEAKSCAQGDTVSLNVSVSSTSGVKSGAVEVLYDSTKLQLVEASWNTSGALLATFDDSTNKGAFAYATETAVSGRIFTVKFKVLSDAPLGETAVECKIQLKSGNTDLPVTNNAGKITVTCKHNFTEKTTNHPASPASCTSAAKYYYTCSVCGEKGNTTFTEGSPTAHVYDKEINTEAFLVSPVTCSDTAEFYYSCQCGAKGSEKFSADASFSHNFSEAWMVGKDGHWHGCIDCGKKKDYAVHSGEICSACSFVSDGGHVHSFGTTYKTDENGHWYECSCGEKSGLALHTYDDGEVTEQPSLTKEGEKLLTCTVCAKTKTESIPKLVGVPTGDSDDTPASTVTEEKEGLPTVAIIAITVLALLAVEGVAFAIFKATKKPTPPAEPKEELVTDASPEANAEANEETSDKNE